MRICSKDECGNPQFGGGFCSWHQGYRTDKVKKPRLKGCRVASSKPRVAIKKVSDSLPSLYMEILSERENISFLSGKPLSPYDKRNFVCCAHVLAKGQNKYPRFKAYKKNIVLLTYMEHHLFDNGSEAQRNEYAIKNSCSWQPLYDLKEELLDEYKDLPSL